MHSAELFSPKDYRQLFIDRKIIYSTAPIPFQYFNYDMLYPYNPLDHYYLIIRNFFLDLANKSHLFWTDQRGNIVHCYQNTKKCIPLQNMDLLLSSLSKQNVKTFKNQLELQHWEIKQQKLDRKNQSFMPFQPKPTLIALDTLPMILGEKFSVNEKQFIKENNEIYINKFYPNSCLADIANFVFIIGNLYPICSDKYNAGNKMDQNKYHHVMQYLYHISRYRADGFNYIMCWLSNMIRYITNNITNSDLFRSVLILRGGEKSGKEIFFNQIIQPIFGSEYCLRIDDKTLSKKSIEKEKSNKIFYNFDNISSSSLKDIEKKEFIRDILTKQDKNIVGIVITTDKKYIPYDLSGVEYVVLDLPDDIETMYIPDKFHSQFSLKYNLSVDLDIFSSILKHYVPSKEILYTKDIDITKKPTLENCIVEFASELTNSKNIPIFIEKAKENNTDENFENIRKLYDKHKKVERKYIYEVFKQKYDYDISATTLYKKLKELDGNLFKTVLAPGGAKCFYFPDKN
nr:hypothetical protein [uncultured Campylobacter sp.]